LNTPSSFKSLFGSAIEPAFDQILIFFAKIECGLYFLDRFDVLVSKMIFKKMKKHHWHVFRHEKLFEKQLLPHCQTHSHETQ
jgi:hypothetical protein